MSQVLDVDLGEKEPDDFVAVNDTWTVQDLLNRHKEEIDYNNTVQYGSLGGVMGALLFIIGGISLIVGLTRWKRLRTAQQEENSGRYVNWTRQLRDRTMWREEIPQPGPEEGRVTFREPLADDLSDAVQNRMGVRASVYNEELENETS